MGHVIVTSTKQWLDPGQPAKATVKQRGFEKKNFISSGVMKG